jgi:ubiquitin C-terminal hydrolase
MRGIVNLANTCHFSSALQCLLHIPKLTDHVASLDYDGTCGFTRAYIEFVRGGDGSYDPTTLFRELQKQFPRISEFDENDLQETVLLVIDILEKEIPELKKWFYGVRVQETVYPGGTSTMEDAFGACILPMMESGNLLDMLERAGKWNALTDFVDDDGKSHNVATTRSLIRDLPKFPMFTFDRKGIVNAPTALKARERKFTLVAAGLHLGTQSGGHYVTLGRSRTGDWYLFDDEHVRKVDFETKAPYSLLVYAEDET